MGMWFTETGSINVHRLEPLDLCCNSGHGNIFYVYGIKNKKLKLELSKDEFDNIEEYMKKYNNNLRIKKMNTI